MKLPPLSLADISRFRGEQMGFAMLIIVLFHVWVARYDAFFGLHRMGNLGVDIFFFLSGMGLWYSWMGMGERLAGSVDAQGKKRFEYCPASLWTFYVRRMVRIYPAWLVVAGLYYGTRFHATSSAAWVDLAGDVLINWDFWLHDELTFWYIPATMMLYLVAPAYMELIRRHPVWRWMVVLMVVWCCAVQWVAPIHQGVGHLEIFWSRVPIFFLGVNMAAAIRAGKTVEGSAFWLLLITFAATLSLCVYLEQALHGRFPLFVERMIYIPLALSTIMILNVLLARMPAWALRGLRFIGALSLEIYLIHAHFVLERLPRDWGYWPKAAATLAITLPIAWLLAKLAERVAKAVTPLLLSKTKR